MTRQPCCRCGGDGFLTSLDDHERMAGIMDSCYHCCETGYCDCPDIVPQCEITAEQQLHSDELKRIAVRGYKWYRTLKDGAAIDDPEAWEVLPTWDVDQIKTFLAIGHMVSNRESK